MIAARWAPRNTALGSALRWSPGSDKFRLLTGILLAIAAGYGVTYLVIAASRGWHGGFGDSFALWMWGRFAVEHPAISIYDPAVLRAAQLGFGMDPGASYPFGYPPSFLLVLWPLSHLPGPIALAVLMVLTLPLYLCAAVGRSWRRPALLAALAAPTTAIVIVSGQSGFLATALLAGGLRLVAPNPVASGVLFGLLTYKPQLGLLVPVALVSARRWRTLAVAALTTILLVILTSLLFGGMIWPCWVAALPGFSGAVVADGSEILHLMPTVLAALVQLGVSLPLAQAAQWAAAAAAAAMVWLLFRAGAGQLAAAGLLVAAPLATPYAFVYDLPIIAIAIIWLVAERQRAGDAFGTGEMLVMILAMIAPMTLAAEHTAFPIGTVSLIFLLGMIARRFWLLRRQQAPALLAAADS